MKRGLLTTGALIFALTLTTMTAIAFAADRAGGAVVCGEDIGGDDAGEMERYFFGSGDYGEFPGTLVCLKCDLGGKEKCADGAHRHALKMDDMVHPLIAGSKETQQKINDPASNGKQVKVIGKYFVETGVIFVSEITPAKP